MHVYFVRHGQTLLSEKHIHQSPNTPLSEKGRRTIAMVGESLRGVNPTLLLSSEYTRALESARIIGQHTGLTPVVNGLFYEVIRPSKLYHTHTYALKTLWYMALTAIRRNDPLWRYDDAENFSDIRNRVIQARTYLESIASQHETVIVVSHTAFLNVLIAYLCRERILNFFDLFKVFIRSERMQNGDVIHLVYDVHAPKGTCAWSTIQNVV